MEYRRSISILVACLTFLATISETRGQAYQQYWAGPPNNVWNWQPQYPAVQQGPYYQPALGAGGGGPVWESGWVPIRDFDQQLSRKRGLGGGFYPTPGGGFNSNQEAEEYAKQFYPQLFYSGGGSNSNDALSNIYPWGNSGGYGQGVPYGQPQEPQYGPQQQQQPWMMQTQLQEVIASCDRDYCYRGCRLALLGGGRCTRAGCMCYHSYFDGDGAPLMYSQPEDYIWHSLKQDDRAAIVRAMREGTPRKPPPTKPPKLPPLPPAIVGNGFEDPRNPNRPSPMFNGEEDVIEEEAGSDPWGAAEEEEEEEEVVEEGPGGGWWSGPQEESSATAAKDVDASGDEEDEDPFGFDDDPFS